MSAATSVTFVLVPGSFTVPKEYDKVEALLQKAGHKTKTIDLLSANDGTRLPPATTADDTAHIREGIIASLDEGSNVVLAVHSYSGIPGSAAVKGLDTKTRTSAGMATSVLGILYIAAFMPEVGDSVRGILVQHDAMPEPFLTGFPGGYMPPVPQELASAAFNDFADEEEVKKYHGLMVQHSNDAYSGEIEYAGWKDIPSILILPGADMILPVKVQEWMFERAEKAGSKKRFIENAGHCINVSQPDVVVEELIKLAGQ